MRKVFSFAICSAVFGWSILACDASAGPLDSQGASKAVICSACHGFGGNSPGGTVPILAGMSPVYFKKAIQDYAEGRRPSPEMEPYSKYVVQFGLDEIAAYFAGQKRQPTKIKADPKAVARGKAQAGPCTVCHNPQGEGEAEKGIPVLQGQPPDYLQAQMIILKEEKRKLEDATLDELKKKLLKRLGDREIADLAAYYSSLR